MHAALAAPRCVMPPHPPDAAALLRLALVLLPLPLAGHILGVSVDHVGPYQVRRWGGGGRVPHERRQGTRAMRCSGGQALLPPLPLPPRFVEFRFFTARTAIYFLVGTRGAFMMVRGWAGRALPAAAAAAAEGLPLVSLSLAPPEVPHTPPAPGDPLHAAAGHVCSPLQVAAGAGGAPHWLQSAPVCPYPRWCPHQHPRAHPHPRRAAPRSRRCSRCWGAWCC